MRSVPRGGQVALGVLGELDNGQGEGNVDIWPSWYNHPPNHPPAK